MSLSGVGAAVGEPLPFADCGKMAEITLYLLLFIPSKIYCFYSDISEAFDDYNRVVFMAGKQRQGTTAESHARCEGQNFVCSGGMRVWHCKKERGGLRDILRRIFYSVKLFIGFLFYVFDRHYHPLASATTAAEPVSCRKSTTTVNEIDKKVVQGPSELKACIDTRSGSDYLPQSYQELSMVDDEGRSGNESACSGSPKAEGLHKMDRNRDYKGPIPPKINDHDLLGSYFDGEIGEISNISVDTESESAVSATPYSDLIILPAQAIQCTNGLANAIVGCKEQYGSPCSVTDAVQEEDRPIERLQRQKHENDDFFWPEQSSNDLLVDISGNRAKAPDIIERHLLNSKSARSDRLPVGLSPATELDGFFADGAEFQKHTIGNFNQKSTEFLDKNHDALGPAVSKHRNRVDYSTLRQNVS